MKNLSLLTAFMALLMSCNNNQVNKENNTAQQPAAAVTTDTAAPAVAKTEYKTKTGKVLLVSESHPQGQSLSNITVAFAGDPASEIKFTDVDPINKVLVGDLDGNGFDEIYLITVTAGTGSYGNVIGVASNADKSLSMVTFPPVDEKELKKGGKFEGYDGHDVFEITGNSLVRTFPTKGAKTTYQTLNYKMKPGEAGYLLYIKNSAAN
jgi:hypothetical protein